MTEHVTQAGKPSPMGVLLTQNGANFCIFSRHAERVFLDLFKNEHDAEPYFSFEFSKTANKTGDLWHVHIQGVKEGALYLYRVGGPYKPEKGLRFNKNNYLFDPYAKAYTVESVFKNLPPDFAVIDSVDIELGKKRSAKGFPKCVVVNDEFDWEGTRPLNYPMRNTVLYEAHLKGMTQSPSSNVKYAGTYRGLIEKIPYLKELGITSIELLPIQEFDEYENANINPRTGGRLFNYWGYSTIGFFAPKASYAADKTPGGAVREFKEMVRELHKNGLEIILDIVFNHTAEGNEHGLTLNFRGLDNPIYYILEEQNKQFYKNFSGCGNTFNCNHPVVRAFILDCLRYWVTEMHVDGFRFDLGSILGRDQNGNLMENPPILERIAEEPVLRDTKIIAEAWDAGGAYQVGSFPGGRWSEWNDRFRDDIRKYWRGDSGLASPAATRFAGSSDLYLRDGRKPFHSINFITSHDGFTLNDLVSYNGKHNDENGEKNRDGSDNNYSYNHGFEGESQNKTIEKMRTRQIKNFLLSLMLSQGTPMLLAGDECRRTQHGNNNAYCQDNEISWFDWKRKDTYADIFRFARNIIAFRLAHPVFRRPEFFTGRDNSFNSLPDITWFDENAQQPDWSKTEHFIAFRLDGHRAETFADVDDNVFYIMCNSSDKDVSAKIPLPILGKNWYRVLDTSSDAPADFLPAGEEEALTKQSVYILPAKTSAVLIEK